MKTCNPRDRRRYGRLQIKLFLAIAGAIAAMTVAAYLIFSWSFDRGFVEYVNRADEARLQPMAARLAEGYGREGGWAWVAGDRERWIELSRDALGLPRQSSKAGAGDAAPEPAARVPLTIDPRLLLFDADRRQLVGRPEAAQRAVLRPVVWQGKTVGYLGHVPRFELLESIERVYLERQHYAFGVVALGMLLASLMLAAGLAYWLTRRVRALARAADSLIRGDYELRLEAPGHDELAGLARDFNTLAATLGAARRARQQWIADIAHELRTPLAVLRAELEALEDGVRPLDREAVHSLAGETARLSRLVEDLHTLSLSDQGALSLYREPVDVVEVIEDAIGPQRRTVNDRGLALTLRLEGPALVLGDAARLAQVFGNLLQNTLRYTDAPGTLAVAVRRAGDRVLVDWQDSSPGVPAEDLPRLADRLFRVEGSRSRDGGGSGLGLAIARAIVEAHGGTMAARQSELGGLAMELAFPAYGDDSHG